MRRRLLVVLALASACASPAARDAGPNEGTVTRVVDGDTINVRLGAREVKVRLIGVDTPEVSFGVECFGREASSYMDRLLGGERVRLEYDAELLDRFGRTLAYVYRARDGMFVNLRLVEAGYASVLTIRPNVVHADEFRRAAARARARGRGLWRACAER